MASGQIIERSWTGGVTNDSYMGIKNSFQYAENLNVFDDMRGIKLSSKVQQRAKSKRIFKSFGDEGCVAVPVFGGDFTLFKNDSRGENETILTTVSSLGIVESVDVFQDFVYCGIYVQDKGAAAALYKLDVKKPLDSQLLGIMNQEGRYAHGAVTVVKNFNNTLLLIGVGKELWTYGKMPDVNNPQGESIEGFTLIKEFEPGIEIVGISPGREYVKIFTVDEGFNSKIQYFQGSFDMADAGVINCVELSNQEIQRVYPLGTTDYYTNHIKTGNASIANAIQFKKVVGYEDYTILKMHAGLQTKDIEDKLGYFIGPTSYQFAFYENKIYVADAVGIWEFIENNPLELGVLKRRLNTEKHIPYGLEFYDGYLYASYDHAEFRVRVFDSGIDGYQSSGFLISRVLESEYSGFFTKTIQDIITQYELNPMTTGNGKIEIFIAPNRQWTDVGSDPTTNGRIKIGEINQNFSKKMTETRRKGGQRKFLEDFETIEYLIKISTGNDSYTTPIFRGICINYDLINRTKNFGVNG